MPVVSLNLDEKGKLDIKFRLTADLSHSSAAQVVVDSTVTMGQGWGLVVEDFHIGWHPWCLGGRRG